MCRNVQRHSLGRPKIYPNFPAAPQTKNGNHFFLPTSQKINTFRIPNKFADLDLNCCLKKCFHWIYWRPIPLKSNLCIIQIRLSDKAFILSPTKIHQKVCQSVSHPHILKSQQDSWWSVRAAIGSSLLSCTYVCLCLSLMSVFYSLDLPVCFWLQNTIVEEALPVRPSVCPSIRASIGQSGVSLKNANSSQFK